MDEPSLKKFLDFRLEANDLEDRDTEHRQYKTELEIIKNYHGENSEIGAKAIRWLKQFKASVLIYSILCDTNYHTGYDWYWERLRLVGVHIINDQSGVLTHVD